MKANPECLLCLFNQALNTARFASTDPKAHERILRRVALIAAKESLLQTPTVLSHNVYRIVAEETGVKDPYTAQKEETNRIALEMLPELRGMIKRSKKPLEVALHAAVAGNIIDLGIGHKFDLSTDIHRLMKQPFAINSIAHFEKELLKGRKLLYLGDNAGEIVFDTLVVEAALSRGVNVTYVVKSGPIINDATMEDAKTAGMTSLCEVIETGSNDIGVNWKNTSATFRKAVKSADAIIAKGHGNFESCDQRSENFYFLLKAKCAVVASALGVQLGDLVFKRHALKR